MVVDELYGVVEVGDSAHRHLVVEPFAAEIIVLGMMKVWICSLEGIVGFGIGVDGHMFLGKSVAYGG